MSKKTILIGFTVALFAAASVWAAPTTHKKVAAKKKTTIVKKTTHAKKAAPKKVDEEALIAENHALEQKVALLEEQFKTFTQNRDNPAGGIDWYKHLRFSGLINVEGYDYTDPDFQVKGLSHSRQLSLATAKLNADAFVNDWVKGHLGLFYSSTMNRYYFTNTSQNNSRTNGVVLDEGYITIGNFKKSPFFLRAGQQYLPFGTYNRYPISESLTQVLTETRSVAAEIGLNDASGLTGSLSALDGLQKANHTRRNDVDNYVAALSYENRNHPVGFNVGMSYINNMIDVGSISYNLNNASTYNHRVGGLAAHADLFTGPFDLITRFVSATRQFNVNDLSYQVRPGKTSGAKPKALSLLAGYAFKTKGYESRIQLGYEVSREARNVNSSAGTRALTLPRNRWSIGYGIKVLKNFIVAVEFRRDHDYSKYHGGSNRYNNAGTLRLTVLV